MAIHETKSFLHNKETSNRRKRQLPEWENIFANDTLNKELISKIYKEINDCLQVSDASSLSISLWKKPRLVFIKPKTKAKIQKFCVIGFIPYQSLVQSSLCSHLVNLDCPKGATLQCPDTYWETVQPLGLRKLLGPHGCYRKKMGE